MCVGVGVGVEEGVGANDTVLIGHFVVVSPGVIWDFKPDTIPWRHQDTHKPQAGIIQ